MEQDKLDDLFRNIIREDDTALNEEERASKEVVWNRLELPKKKSRLDFWKIAAAILFLLLSGTMALLMNHQQMEGQRFSHLELELKKTKHALHLLEGKLNESEIALNENLKSTIENSKIETTDNSIPESKTIEKIVMIHDTIWIGKNIKINEHVRLVKDTVFIEVPAKSPAQWVNETIKEESIEEEIDKKKITKKKKYPSKVEFVFGKKPLAKPKQKLDLFLNESEFAKKEKKKGDLITIPINN